MRLRTNIETVAVIGAGTMGSGIAQTFALAGRTVLMHDARPGAVDAALKSIEKSLLKLEQKQRIGGGDARLAMSRLQVSELADCKAADLVIEAIVEELGAKGALFEQLNSLCPPEVVFASNTSSISITKLAERSGRPDHFIGMHFFNPVPLMALVEIVVGKQTGEPVVKLISELSKELHKTPLIVRDSPGFVSNRVLMPMINEAIGALQDEVADAATIDEIMKLGCNFPMGPLTLADFIGLDVCLFILEVLHRDLGDERYRPAELLRSKVRAGELGRKSGKGFHNYEQR